MINERTLPSVSTYVRIICPIGVYFPSAIMLLPDELSPCENVRRSCYALMREEKREGYDSIVEIDSNKLSSLAQQISQSIVNKKNNNGDKNAELNVTEWDEEGWHYSGSCYKRTNLTKDELDIHRRERVALYVLALDAINFCFWPLTSPSPKKKTNSLEYDHLAIALKKVASADDEIFEANLNENIDSSDTSTNNKTVRFEAERSYALSPRNLIQLTAESFLKLIQPHLPSPSSNDNSSYEVPGLSERVRLLRELGHGLLQYYRGSALYMIQTANQHADTLVHILTASFPGFRDSAIHCTDGYQIFFYKRAQICVGDLWASLHSSTTPTLENTTSSTQSGIIDDDNKQCGKVKVTDFQNCCDFVDLKKLTTFADYRVPQLLRNFGVLKYCPELANIIDNMGVLEAGSKWELYIRAATVVAVEKLVESVKQSIKANIGSSNNDDVSTDGITALKLDWYLWQLGEKLNREDKLSPFHMVRTIFY